MSLPPEHSIITKSNDLINAHYRLNIFESRIIFLLASMVQPQDMEFKRYTFKAKEIANMLGLSGNSIYVELEKITLGLLKKTFTIKTERENKKDSLLQINWLASAEYIDGVVELEFSPKLKPYFLQLKAKFTSYKLHDVIRLKSIHSFRIYELLKQYQKFGNRTFELEELRDLLNVGDDYPRYANFKAKVLLVAQKDIAEKTDMNFDIEEIKKGRSVTKIKFIIYSKIKGEGEINVEDRVDLAGRLENVFGLTSARVLKVMRDHEKEYIENNLLVVEENMYLGRIQKVPAYTQAALKENYAKSYTPFELDCLRKLVTKEDKDQYYSIKKAFQKECLSMTDYALKMMTNQGKLPSFVQRYMAEHPELQSTDPADLFDFSTLPGQRFSRYIFERNYPDFSFEYYYKKSKDLDITILPLIPDEQTKVIQMNEFLSLSEVAAATEPDHTNHSSPQEMQKPDVEENLERKAEQIWTRLENNEIQPGELTDIERDLLYKFGFWPRKR